MPDLSPLTVTEIAAIADPRDRALTLQTHLPHLSTRSDFLETLQTFIQQEADPGVLSIAIRALAHYGTEDLGVLNWFKTYSQYAPNPRVRSLAVQELARNWTTDFNVYEILSKCAFADRFRRQHPDEVNPRFHALKAMIEHYHDLPQTWEFVSDRATNDNDPQVRDFAQAQLEQRS
jgi:hypothetical protein